MLIILRTNYSIALTDGIKYILSLHNLPNHIVPSFKDTHVFGQELRILCLSSPHVGSEQVTPGMRGVVAEGGMVFYGCDAPI